MPPNTLDFEYFVGLFPAGLRVPEGDEPQPVQSQKRRDDFVPPRMRLQSGDPAHASVFLVSAAGAVGKSTVAKEVAARTDAAYWDLSTTQVGSQSYIGMLATVYKRTFAQVDTDLREGRAFFVIDALDEAQVRSGPANFDAFLTDLSSSLTEERERPALLIFGRIDTIEWISLYFEEGGVPFAHYGIDFFEKDQAYAFVARALDHRHKDRGENAPHRRHPGPYERARDSVFALLYKALGVRVEDPWDEEPIRSFLGYAPVLESLANYLDVSDWQRLAADIEALGGELGSLDNAGPGRVLLAVIRQIIEREKQKMTSSVGPAVQQQLQSGQALPDLYGEGEQMSRILASTLDLPTEADVPLSGAALQCYESHIETQVPQHPFRQQQNQNRDFSSIVFKEYCIAWALTRSSADIRISVCRALAAKMYRPTHLLAQFYFSLVDNNTRLEGEAFGLLYESVREPVGGKTPFLVLSNVDKDEAIAELIPPMPNPGTLVPTIRLSLSSPICFWYHLADAMIGIRGSVQFGLPGVGFVMGPLTALFAQSLLFKCSSLQVHCPERTRSVFLCGRKATECPPDVSLRVRGDAQNFSVSWPRVGHPWVPYQRSVPQYEAGSREHWDVLRKLLLMFCRQNTRRVDTVTGSRWATVEAALRDKLLDLAVRHGVLTMDGEFYIFDNAFRPLMDLLEGKPLTHQRSRDFVDAFTAA